ncbi:TnsA endonuclease N-terminal domain-containing protein [Marinobacter salicampi]|uniref:TnsA endonuclease N-terminal domain-containing protein n=1 Tax=Marinobacter salicampi TaxID=435907 RepID=UPI00140BBB05|nr:TnsA endonuclease N-terminal domain-containing protein [Marinobacter salicampi]
MPNSSPNQFPSVQGDTLEPRQRATRQSMRIATEFSVQCMLKHPHRSEFHCRSEHLYAGLLEGNPAVISFVPQPFTFGVGRCRYTPDFFVQAKDRAFVVEVKPEGKVDNRLTEPVAHFLRRNGIDFDVVHNAGIIERAVEAENWLEIVRVLHVNRDLPTESVERRLLEEFYQEPERALADVVNSGDRAASYDREIALFRLLHRGLLRAELSEQPLDFTTVVLLS